ncbi:MAG: RNA polymerase sigma-70 factor [Reichenbachiella sp.]
MENSVNLTDLSQEKTFEKVFQSYYQQLAAFAFQYLSDHDLAEEMVQETFSNIWHKAHNIEIRTTVKSYLYGAVRNGCLNYIKHQEIERKFEASEKRKDDFDQIDFLELEELQSEIDKALEKLPEKCRQIFEMSRYEDKMYKEIAEELGISIKTVETQMGRALKVMRSSLNRYLPALIFWIIYHVNKDL